MQHEILEEHSLQSSVDEHQDQPHPDVSNLTKQHPLTPSELDRHQEFVRGDIPAYEAKIEFANAHGRPKHPVWQYFSHAHLQQHTKQLPRLKHSTTDHVEVTCNFCHMKLVREETMTKGSNEALVQIQLTRAVLHDMLNHLSSCTMCPSHVRLEMKSWPSVPRSFGGKHETPHAIEHERLHDPLITIPDINPEAPR
ncbi:hypothetical protein Poli38472_002545 [Pythium oligandrum]|uniref:Uncharacterized protein n=1 Tax=Pythium oligandrum TaxID=41045 RepID=A0A8K1CIC6_PYTOL|nr:hypothetical protein Poli38472_002545 [Pythium oligandrum]|eukprot:TMW63604.1 hypothetical protein Poli38472_002545 [Pythium oligandrum]